MTLKNNMPSKDVYKICPKCQHEWQTQMDLLNDSTLYILGFQAAFTENDEGFILFNHIPENDQCNTTFSLKVSDFRNLHDGPLYDDIKYEKDECSGFCAKIENLSRCSAKCRNANARDIINKILENYSIKKIQKQS
jgi:hypothetical protein